VANKWLTKRISSFPAQRLLVNDNQPVTSAGQTAWKRPEVLRGPEADECYFFPDKKGSAVDRRSGQLPDNQASEIIRAQFARACAEAQKTKQIKQGGRYRRENV
jgi:hypothetical protein